MQVTTIGIDLAKNVFQVHGVDANEKVVFNKPLRRSLGERGGSRPRAGTARSATRRDDRAPLNRRAPFGTIKAWMGATHFKVKTLRNVATEMALHVLAYNIKRVIAILGVQELLRAI